MVCLFRGMLHHVWGMLHHVWGMLHHVWGMLWAALLCIPPYRAWCYLPWDLPYRALHYSDVQHVCDVFRPSRLRFEAPKPGAMEDRGAYAAL